MSNFDFSHARHKRQVDIMAIAQQNEVCPFCWEAIEKYHPEPILKKGVWWWVSKNAWPYQGSDTHLIFFYKEHIDKISKIALSAFEELGQMVGWVEEEYKLNGCGLFIRSGKMEYTGSSVQHIHAQLIAGNSNKFSPESEPLKVKLGYRKK